MAYCKYHLQLFAFNYALTLSSTLSSPSHYVYILTWGLDFISITMINKSIKKEQYKQVIYCTVVHREKVTRSTPHLSKPIKGASKIKTFQHVVLKETSQKILSSDK